MKYGAHCYLFTRSWSDADIRFLDTAAELGLAMFELSIGDDVVFDARWTGRHAAELGLDLIVGPGGLWPLDCDLSSDDPGERAKGLTWHKRQVDTAAALGAVAYGGSLYGHSGVVKRRRPPVDEYPRTAEGLYHLAEYAAGAGVAILLEPMSHFRTHLVNTPAQVMKLVRIAGHPNLGTLFDTYHVITEVRSYADAIRILGPSLKLVHACESDRGVPGGGLVPWNDVFLALAQIGYDGYIGLEAYNSSLGDFAFERGMFHNVCPDGAAFVREGLRFLRSMEARYRASS
jgi:D-psicose/D-tagatose/L-ribulose 3-epimerase